MYKAGSTGLRFVGYIRPAKKQLNGKNYEAVKDKDDLNTRIWNVN